jgi:type IV pilus assembly protein PilN
VILINLLPHREAKRKQRKQAFFVGLGLAAAVGALVAGAWYMVLKTMTDAQISRNEFLRSEIRRLDAQVKDIATLKAEIEALTARQKAVEDLQTERNIPVHLMDELARQTPEGIFLGSIRQAGAVVTINGVAQTNERVSEFLRNTNTRSPWLEKPELVEIKAANVTTAGKDPRRLYEFTMRVSIKKPSAVVPAGAASAVPAAPGGAPKKAA